MANINSNLVTAQAAAQRDPSAGLVNMDDALGIILIATCTVTLLAAAADESLLNLIPAELVPVGAVVIPQLCTVYCVTDPGSGTLTLDVGDALDPDRYADALALTVAGTASGAVSFAASASVPDGIANPYRIPAQAAIYATIKGYTATEATSTVLVFNIAYRAKG